MRYYEDLNETERRYREHYNRYRMKARIAGCMIIIVTVALSVSAFFKWLMKILEWLHNTSSL